MAAGKRPCLGEAITRVLGDRTLNAQSIIEGLRKFGWLPASTDPATYIGHFLSTRSHPDDPGRLFDRIKGHRGWYRAAEGSRHTQGHDTCFAMRIVDASTEAVKVPVRVAANDVGADGGPVGGGRDREALSLYRKFRGVDTHLATSMRAHPERRALHRSRAVRLAKMLLERIGQADVVVTDEVLTRLQRVARKQDLLALCQEYVRKHPLPHAQPTRAILTFVMEHPGTSSREVIDRLGLPRTITLSALAALQTRGQAVRRADGKWFPVSEKPDLKSARERAARDLRAAVRVLETLPKGARFASTFLAERIGRQPTAMAALLRALADGGLIERASKGWVRL